jgi:ClpP class serine protease
MQMQGSNRHIDEFILSGQFEIEEEWGFAQLVEYLNEIALLKSGAPYSELGIGRRRAASRPGLIVMGAEGPRMVRDKWKLSEHEETPPGSIAHLRLSGVMRASDGASSSGVQSLVDSVHEANMNPNIEGILIEANTGGGESLAGTMLQSVIADSPKAVVVYAHLLASAGIRGTVTADEIIGSSNAAQFGSIGSYMTFSKDFARLYNQWYEDIYADKSVNKNADFREFLKGNLQPLKDNLNRSNQHFLNEVQQYRQLKGDVNHTLSGAMFDAKAARSRGLIDGIGSFTYAVSRLMANVERRKK